MAKISQILSILSCILSASMLGAGVYGYIMVTSDEFKEKMIQQKLLEVYQMSLQMFTGLQVILKL